MKFYKVSLLSPCLSLKWALFFLFRGKEGVYYLHTNDIHSTPIGRGIDGAKAPKQLN